MDITTIILTATDSLIYVLLIGFATVIAFFCFNWFSFKHKIRVRQYGANGTMSVYDDMAKEIKDKDGNRLLKLRKRGDKLPMPEKGAVDIDQKGRWVIEVYLNSSGVYIYGNTEIKDLEDKKNGDSIDVLIPLSDTKKIHWLNVIEKAKMDMGLDKEKLLMTFGALAFVLILIFMVFMMWGDIMQPSIDMANIGKEIVEANLEIAKTNADTARMLQQIIQDKQTFAVAQAVPLDVPN